MAIPKKGQLHQFMVPLVDSTDFASVESGITESDFNSGATVKFYGVDHGTSAAFTSGTVSKTGRLVRSGVFQITLKGTENNYDEMMVRINKTGVAEQIVTWANADYDDSDIQSSIGDVYSYIQAAMAESDLSAIYAQAAGASNMLSGMSNILSQVLVDTATTLPATLSQISDTANNAYSAATAGASRALLVQSRLSDLDSRIVSNVSDILSAIDDITVTISASDVSDIASAVVAALPIASQVSDIYSLLQDNYSLLSDFNSNFGSRVPKEPAARSQAAALDSNLLSYLAGMSGMLSDAHSAAILGASHASDAHSAALLVQSRLSDLDSRLVSDISDVASAVAVVNSRVLVTKSTVSDIYSLLSDVSSDVTVLASNVSDIESAIDAGVPISASDMSDIRSAVTAAGLGAAGADITAVPGVTGTYGAKLDWLFALARNKVTQTSALAAVFNDAGSQVASATVSDDATTFTRQEWAG